MVSSELAELPGTPGKERDQRPKQHQSGRGEAPGPGASLAAAEKEEQRWRGAGQRNGKECRCRSARDQTAGDKLDRQGGDEDGGDPDHRGAEKVVETPEWCDKQLRHEEEECGRQQGSRGEE